MKKRGVIIHPDELSEYWVKLMLISGLNTLGIHPVGGLTGGLAVENAVSWIRERQVLQRLNVLQERGIALEYEMHAASWLLPRSLFKKQPDWFRMDETGKRNPDSNFCFSNRDALEYISQRAFELAKVFVPSTHRHHLWLDDTDKGKCHCPECRQVNMSDLALAAYEAVLKGLRARDSRSQQCYLAYQDTLTPPKRTVPDGIFLEYAPFKRDVNLALNDETSEKNRLQTEPLSALLSAFNSSENEALDYWLDNSMFSGWEKPVKRLQINLEIAKADIGFYHSLGIENITCFACYLGEEYLDLYNEYPPVKEYAKLFSV